MKRTAPIGMLALFFAFNLFSAPLDQWYRRNPLQDWDTLVSVAYGNGRLVAIGEFGTVVVSTNGADWEAHQRRDESGGPLWQTRIAFGNGVFVMVNGLNYYTSIDGVHWQERFIDPVNGRTRVVFCGGQFMALGSGDDVLTSPDGITWTRTLLPVPAGSFMMSAASGQGITIIVGIVPNAGGVVVRTTNGVDWAPSPFSDSLAIAAFDGTEFHIHGGPTGALFGSTNGLNWVDRRVGNASFPAIATYNGRTVLGGGDLVVIQNGISTFIEPTALDNYSFGIEGLTVANGTFWSVGMGGMIRHSTNGVDWTEVTRRIAGLPASQPLWGIAFDGKKFIAAGDSECITSTDGVSWVRMASHPNIYTLDLTYANGRWVAVGGDHSTPQNELIASSTNGTNWTLHAVAGISNQFLYRVKYLNGRFIAVGDGGRIAVSTSGTNWTMRQVGSTTLNSITFGRGIYMAVGEGDSIYTSTDAVTWTSHVINNVYRFKDITFGRNRFVAAVDTPLYDGDYQQIWSSSDGRDWTPHAGYVQRVTYEDGVFIAAGFGRIYTSFNGNHFALQNEIINQEPLGIAFGRRTFVIVGNYASIVQSSPLPPHILLSVIHDNPALGPLIAVDTPGEGDHEIQWSSDTQNWTTFATINGTNEILRVRHTNAPAAGPAFYRAIQR